MPAVGTQVSELTDEHRDGTIWADISGDLWTPCWPMGGWIVTRQVPFFIHKQHIYEGDALYGPYLAVLGPPERAAS